MQTITRFVRCFFSVLLITILSIPTPLFAGLSGPNDNAGAGPSDSDTAAEGGVGQSAQGPSSNDSNGADFGGWGQGGGEGGAPTGGTGGTGGGGDYGTGGGPGGDGSGNGFGGGNDAGWGGEPSDPSWGGNNTGQNPSTGYEAPDPTDYSGLQGDDGNYSISRGTNATNDMSEAIASINEAAGRGTLGAGSSISDSITNSAPPDVQNSYDPSAPQNVDDSGAYPAVDTTDDARSGRGFGSGNTSNTVDTTDDARAGRRSATYAEVSISRTPSAATNPGLFAQTSLVNVKTELGTPKATAQIFSDKRMENVTVQQYDKANIVSVPANVATSFTVVDTAKVSYQPPSFEPIDSVPLDTSTFHQVEDDIKALLPSTVAPYSKINGIPVASPAEALFMGKLDLTRGGKYDATRERAALEAAIRAEIPGFALSDINKGKVTQDDLTEAVAVITTVVNRAVAKDTSIETQVNKPAQITSIANGRSNSVNDTGVAGFVSNLTDGTYSRELGLNTIAPDDLAFATHYYSPAGIRADTNGARSTPAGWNIDPNSPNYTTKGGHIVGNVVPASGKGLEYDNRGVQLAYADTNPNNVTYNVDTISLGATNNTGTQNSVDTTVRSVEDANAQFAKEQAQIDALTTQLTNGLSSKTADQLSPLAKDIDQKSQSLQQRQDIVQEARSAASTAEAQRNAAEKALTDSLSRLNSSEADQAAPQAKAVDVLYDVAKSAQKNAEVSIVAAANNDLVEATAAKALARQDSYVSSRLAEISMNDPAALSTDQAINNIKEVGRYATISGLDSQTRAALEDIAARLGFQLPVISTYRDKEHNKEVGGAKHSQHLDHKAVDIDISKLSPQQQHDLVQTVLSNPNVKGFGWYGNTIHFDTRAERTGKGYWGSDRTDKGGDANGKKSSVDFDNAVAQGKVPSDIAGLVTTWSTNGPLEAPAPAQGNIDIASLRSEMSFTPDEEAALAAMSLADNNPNIGTARQNAQEAISKMEQARSLQANADLTDDEYSAALESEVNRLSDEASSLASANKELADQSRNQPTAVAANNTGNIVDAAVGAVKNAVQREVQARTTPAGMRHTARNIAIGAVGGPLAVAAVEFLGGFFGETGTPNLSVPNFWNNNQLRSGSTPIGGGEDVFKEKVGTSTDKFVPVYMQLERSTGEIKMRRDFSQYTKDNNGNLYVERSTSSTPIVLGEDGSVVYSDGTYAPETIAGQQLDNETKYVYFTEVTDHGQVVPLQNNEEALPGNKVTRTIGEWFDNDNPFTIEDVDHVNVRVVDPNTSTAGDEYKVYTVFLNDNSQRNIAVPVQTSLAFVETRFKKSGYQGNVLELIALAKETVDAGTLDEAQKSFLARIKDFITNPFKKSTNEDAHTTPFSFSNLDNTNISQERSNDLIESIDVYFNLPGIECPNAPGLNRGYVYQANLTNGNSLTHVRCGTGNAYTYAEEVALHMYKYEGFTNITPAFVLDHLTFNFYYPGDNTSTDSALTDVVGDLPDKTEPTTLPTDTNLIAFEVRVRDQNGSIVRDWTRTDVTISDTDHVSFRWNAGDQYQRCLLYLADDGRYSLSRTSDFSMTTGNTELEGFDVPERTGPYRIECNQNTSGEKGVDERVIYVTVQ